jgi:ferrous iron transport protein B
MSPTTFRPRMPERDAALVQLGVRSDRFDYLVALAGNPNTGKSTVFNELTGLRQHTGNWPGKTVTRAEGLFTVGGSRFKLVDLPGTYSLQAASDDEEVARDMLLFGRPDVTVLVLDATRLERNLNLALQVLEVTSRVVVCLNLMDEARRVGIAIDPDALSRELGVPVIATAARQGEGLDALRTAVRAMATLSSRPAPFRVARFAPDIEALIDEVREAVHAAYPALPNARWVALRLLNADERVEAAVRSGEFDLLAREEPLAPQRAAVAEATRARVLVTAGPGDEHETSREAADPGDGDAVLAVASAARWRLPSDFHDRIAQAIYEAAEGIAQRSLLKGQQRVRFDFDRVLDRWLTSPVTGFPLMILMLGVVFWLTIAGANVPSALLGELLVDNGHGWLRAGADAIGAPAWLSGLLIDGVYLATAWVVAVMLPPMAIFFPLFTLLEDFGYLPRVAFNLDALFRRVGAHGKQALTMCMGFGCNAAGVVATRVIDSPRERLVAIITNNFSLCNGRWPTQILMASIFVGALAPAPLAGLVSATAVVGVTLLGVLAMFLSSWLLTRTVLRGEATSFSLELPPYRPPRILQTLYTSLVDRTLIVLWRAVVFAAPAGAAIWLVSNVHVGGPSVAEHLVGWLNPLGLLIGLNGVILLAYVVAIPANEIVIPTVLMLTVLTGGVPEVGAGAGVMFELDAAQIGELLRANGWTTLTAACLMLFSLLHNPCSTTIYTIYKETGSARWTALSTMLPLVMGFVTCFLVAQLWRLATGS